MNTHIRSVAQRGFDGIVIDVECDASNGLPSVNIVGLAGKSVDEAKERVRSAITNSGLKMPTRRLTLNLAPADVPKQGSYLDLPMAVAILSISKQIPESFAKDSVIAGELSLDGKIRPVRGIINLAQTAKSHGITKIIIPRQNANQASLVDGVEIIAVSSLQELYKHACDQVVIAPYSKTTSKTNQKSAAVDLADIKEQAQAKRALVIAAAGNHNIMLAGPPGTGKSMLAKALIGILPPLSDSEKVSVTKIHSIAGINISEVVNDRPFRSPHHTSSNVAIVGGGANPKPGEVSLAHKGVLFLDELPEFSRSSLESLRQPLEDKLVSISRVQDTVTYPADFLLIATKNPCPCGYYGDTVHPCTCSPIKFTSYSNKLSGPLLDRIDMSTSVDRIDNSRLIDNTLHPYTSQSALRDVVKSRTVQARRYGKKDKTNSNMSNKDIKEFAVPDSRGQALLNRASKKLGLSSRAYIRTLKVARTIADLDGSDKISYDHVSEALSFRHRKNN